MGRELTKKERMEIPRQPMPAVMPSVHCGTRTSDRYAPPSPAQAPPISSASHTAPGAENPA